MKIKNLHGFIIAIFIVEGNSIHATVSREMPSDLTKEFLERLPIGKAIENELRREFQENFVLEESRALPADPNSITIKPIRFISGYQSLVFILK